MSWVTIPYRSRTHRRQESDTEHSNNNSTTENRFAALGQEVIAKMKHSPGSRQKVEPENDQGSDPAKTVFNTPELLEAILIHLPIRDLTRALLVSRYSRDVIATSKECRRTLFLESEGPTSFIEWKEGVNQAQYLRHTNEERRYQPVLRHEAGKGRYPITRAYPILKCLEDINTSFVSHLVPRHEFNKTAPSTLLFQPPVTKISIIVRDLNADRTPDRDSPAAPLECDSGVTFGAVVDTLKELYEDLQAVSIRIVAEGVVAEDASCVQLARKVLADQLKANPINPRDQWLAVEFPPLQ